jgi:raffinose/stachyose/melibiose transport system permease protein
MMLLFEGRIVMKKSPLEKTSLGIKYILLIFFTIMCLYPLFWLFLASFKTNQELYQNTWGPPHSWSLVNYISAITKGGVIQYFGNSVIISISAVFVTVILATMASYAITRMHWKLAKLTHSLFLLGMMIPIYALIIPLFSIFKRMSLLNTHLAVIIPQIAVGFPMAIFIICGFMRGVPKELEEAAIIDGCTVFQCFRYIILPISRSSVVTVAVVQFINVWNDLLLPRVFLTDSNKMTLPVGLTNFQAMYSTDYVGMIAAVIITIVPSIIVYIFLHRQIMEGMVAGAVKG